MTTTASTLSEKERAEIELIHEIYRDFRTELTKLERKQNLRINHMIKRIDHAKTQEVLDQLKSS